jgi:hypothetical protein
LRRADVAKKHEEAEIFESLPPVSNEDKQKVEEAVSEILVVDDKSEEAEIFENIHSLSDDEKERLMKIISDIVFPEEDPSDRIDELRSALASKPKTFECIMVSTEAFQQGQSAMLEKSYNDGYELLRKAAIGFDQTGLPELRDASVALAVICMVIIEVLRSNTGRAIELMKRSKVYLKKAG